MAGTISSFLDISRRSLIAAQQGITVLGNNIANVNNPSYSRRQVIYETSQSALGARGQNFGTGVSVGGVRRIFDEFVNAETVQRIGARAGAEIRAELLERSEAVFALDNATTSIGTQLSEFFSSLEDLTSSPGDFGLRTAVIEAGNALTTTINTVSTEIATLQREADQRIQQTLSEINRITGEIATLNIQIRQETLQGEVSLNASDSRDQLLRDLSELIDVDTVVNDDGTILVELPNGFPIVTTTGSNDLEYFTGHGLPNGLDGGQLGQIVFDYSPGAAGGEFDLTSFLATGQGELGGLLQVRGVQSSTDTDIYDASGDLVEVAGRVEAIARDLIMRFNETYYNGGDNVDLNGASAAEFDLFTIAGVADDGDGTYEIDDDVTDNVGQNIAQQISFGISDPDDIAAGRDIDTGTGGIQLGEGDARNIEGLLALRTTAVDFSAYATEVNTTATVEELYEGTVTIVGSNTQNAKNTLSFTQSREDVIQEFRAGISGVNTDEELANLIQLQKTFQASARMIGVADELLNEILGIIS